MKNKTIEIFGSEHCAPCKNAINWLKANNIDFVYYDVEEDENRALVNYYMVNSLPTFVLKNNGKIYVYSGFSPHMKKIILEFVEKGVIQSV